jgi:hypothetical protein
LCGPRYKEGENDEYEEGRDQKGGREEKETRKWKKNEKEDERGRGNNKEKEMKNTKLKAGGDEREDEEGR